MKLRLELFFEIVRGLRLLLPHNYPPQLVLGAAIHEFIRELKLNFWPTGLVREPGKWGIVNLIFCSDTAFWGRQMSADIIRVDFLTETQCEFVFRHEVLDLGEGWIFTKSLREVAGNSGLQLLGGSLGSFLSQVRPEQILRSMDQLTVWSSSPKSQASPRLFPVLPFQGL
ncbi:MAG: hypothetical protein UX02_C0002G0183 [Candidatus Moranbacteria bacterium GW2011_GWC1_45_18]|nr:MAG: hypothetical protein UT79_C0001G0278 [Candidatus Moranbacteria bacterium GW2011_GWC2_40_12]KKT32805.1 MAG: hypothetical protein UW19_C0015G0013 [Candidatus Moranbacteria bacterium GW2011_GWF2_44_10]KKT99864.1 MAG: hypothetical protein UX02_C0002G0183 [Candidatus Moranbacteria bacterium GW2011_GWC1_45_18]OGI40795.1 MAG: hypothetical protein A2374_02065 [Candidatus Moranbacteria bacterium RIFOXYB1_FULL_44_23]OGI43413.1 MAG: hypothetical protein A2593_03360 [Candidatus Moranbacteria bacter